MCKMSRHVQRLGMGREWLVDLVGRYWRELIRMTEYQPLLSLRTHKYWILEICCSRGNLSEAVDNPEDDSGNGNKSPEHDDQGRSQGRRNLILIAVHQHYPESE